MLKDGHIKGGCEKKMGVFRWGNVFLICALTFWYAFFANGTKPVCTVPVARHVL